MPIPATLTSYLPVLLVSVTHNAVPDDSSFDTLPEGQVDYLSHNWKEEDVWRSWRSMTRQKNAIANGMRLENASWRTWWKQRNKLKTISPETLNWLKDSDVTWLYGPLHVGHDWTDYSTKKPSKLNASHRKTSTDAVPGPYKTVYDSRRSNSASAAPTPKKPILKRRSISQLLSLPASPFFNQPDSDDESEDREGEEQSSTPTRPPLMHTKSDTHLNMRGRPFRKNSPPRIIAEDGSATQPPLAAGSEASGSTGSDQDLSGSSSTGADGSHGSGAKKKHISFNTFVEQCIAIEKPNLKRSTTGPTRNGRVFDAFDDGYDSELGYDGEYEEPVSYYGTGSDSEDDDDDVLEMRTSSSRSRSSSSSRGSPFATTFSTDATAASRPRPPMVRRASTDREHVTIAPIPPTILKSTGVGNELHTVPEGATSESPKEVDLVYVPPASYSLPGTPNFGSNEDVYHHRESYFSVGTGTTNNYPRSPLPRSPAPGSSPRIPSVGMPSDHPSGVPLARTSSSTGLYGSQGYVDSPMQIDDISSQTIEDAYDYFGGPDLGEDFSHPRTHLSRRRSRTEIRDDDERVEEITRYAEGGASSVTMGRSSSGTWHPASTTGRDEADMPVVVVNQENGAVEERQERSRESSPSAVSRLPEEASSPPAASLPATSAMPVPVPRVSPAHAYVVSSSISSNHSMASSVPGSVVCDPALLSPADGHPGRGRLPHSPSVSGSTTTGSSSYSHSADSRSASSSRGRSSTRTSSFSDRERSGSRSRSRGTSSPMGSISPTGSAIGIGSAYVGGRCRDRGDRTDHQSRRRGSSDEERGRDRSGRRLANSLSPPSTVSSPSRGSDASDYAYQPYSPVLSDIPEKPVRVPSPPSSVSGSSTETASVSTVGPTQGQQERPAQVQTSERAPRPAEVPIVKSPGVVVAIPSPIPEEEEEERRSRQPTPANSPVAAFRMQVPPAQKAEPVSSPVSASVSTPPAESSSAPTTSSAESSKTPDAAAATVSRHPSRAQRVSIDGMQEQAGTLVNRAAEIVQSARGFLGSIWNSNQA
ncbi:hypothetical protein PYCCODRAFT_1465395 [Trametes coccinea BRFM310]|uniref:Nitrogen regulatory protein areA GATA-like domain-containing protein n=1 Tax=Trametes coccinea (strain BRFM310) TaxID=1353009 RepID=A0A1Y2IWJ2_TRAC3|nr:hypothetical protein PYCCODRAFT_1465395 [Trametes coccinea BRFM310]